MQEKIGLPSEQTLTVRQDAWDESPCRDCAGSPCCTVLPLAALRLESRTDFMNLALLSCYDHIRLLRKKHGEWTVYYARPCRDLDPVTSRCRVHGLPRQNMVCKSYDAHACWYRRAFAFPQNDRAVFFNLDRLFFLEKKTDLLRHAGSTGDLEWEELCREIAEIPCGTNDMRPAAVETPGPAPLFLSFRKCIPEQFLFFPPFGKPEREVHFELAAFRLGFPGVALAVSDTHWAYVLRATLNPALFARLTAEYFPGLTARYGCFSFPDLHRRLAFFSETGEQWLLVQQEHLPLLRRAVRYDAFGNVTDIPGTRELASLLRPSTPRKPDKAA